MHYIHYISLGVNLTNIVILFALLFVYIKNYLHIKSSYNMGLIVFSFLFFAQNLISAHLVAFSWPGFVADFVILHTILLNFIELLGLSTLLAITWK